MAQTHVAPSPQIRHLAIQDRARTDPGASAHCSGMPSQWRDPQLLSSHCLSLASGSHSKLVSRSEMHRTEMLALCWGGVWWGWKGQSWDGFCTRSDVSECMRPLTISADVMRQLALSQPRKHDALCILPAMCLFGLPPIPKQAGFLQKKGFLLAAPSADKALWGSYGTESAT